METQRESEGEVFEEKKLMNDIGDSRVVH